LNILIYILDIAINKGIHVKMVYYDVLGIMYRISWCGKQKVTPNGSMK